jgi:glycosyltransferase involved in cell wall biosynthesis
VPDPKIIVVLPAYNAGRTLAATIETLPADLPVELVLVDDGSTDDTVEEARRLGLDVIRHRENRGYGANQKTCYREALARDADIVVMLHPDGQYDARMIRSLVLPIQLDVCDIVLGNRIRSRRATLDGGMPKRKYFLNRIVTGVENVVLGQNLGEFHSGFRAYSAGVLRRLPYRSFSDGFVFDSELLITAARFGFRLGDVPVPTIYSEDSSQIGFREGTRYLAETLLTLGKYLLEKSGLRSFPVFRPDGPATGTSAEDRRTDPRITGADAVSRRDRPRS